MADAVLEAGGLGARRRSSLSFSFVVDGIWIVLVAGLVLRLIAAFFPGFDIDISLFKYWSQQLADRGPWHFYDQDFFTDYAPGYMYVLFVIGKLDQWLGFSPETYEYILKLPSIAADLGSAYILWRLLEGKKEEIRLLAAAVYLLLPPVLLIGPVWGQVDSVLAFFLLLSVFYVSKGRPVRGAIAFTVGFLVKPQAIAALPFLAFWIMKSHPPRWVKPTGASITWLLGCLLVVIGAAFAIISQVAESSGPAISGLAIAGVGALLLVIQLVSNPAEADGGVPVAAWKGIPAVPALWVRITAICVALLLALIFPFFLLEPWDFISHMRGSTEVYRVNSFWAYNFWNMFGVFDCGFKPDEFMLNDSGAPPGDACSPLPSSDGEMLGIANRWWGLTAFGLSITAIIVALRKKEGAGWLSLGVGLSVLAFYVFVTRMHERYVFPALLPLLAACFLIQSRMLWGLFVAVTVAHFLNLYDVYMNYQYYFDANLSNPDLLKWDWLFRQFRDNDVLGTGLEMVQVISFLLVASLLALLAFAFAYRRGPPGSEAV
jgi:Gpi18-like mannosyltransferase